MSRRQQFQIESGCTNIRQDRPADCNFLTMPGVDGNRFPPSDHNAIHMRVESNLTTRFIQSAKEGLGDRPGTANWNLKSAPCRQKGEHHSQGGAGKILGAEIDMQSQAGNDATGCFGSKYSAGIPGGGGKACAREPQKVERSQPERRFEIWQWS